MDHLRSDQELIRLDELRQLRALGLNPYPGQDYSPTWHLADLRKAYSANPQDPALQDVRVAGRVMNIRLMGKAAFLVLQDSTDTLQLYLNRDELCPTEDKALYNLVFKKLTSVGDIIGVTGHVFTTQTGETSIHVHAGQYQILSKAIRPLPIRKEQDGQVYEEAFSDPDLRYRQRYVDLTLHAEVRERFRKRAEVIQAIRDYLNGHGLLEVDTPVLQPIHGGATARPFQTHHNALDIPVYLRIANELYLKRLIVGGFEGVYEFSRNFRNEGMSRFHNPEFTILEWYIAYHDYHWQMTFFEDLLVHIADTVFQTRTFNVGSNTIQLETPFARKTFYGALQEFTGQDFEPMDEAAIRAWCQAHDVAVDPSMGRGKLLDELIGEFVEPKLIQPTFLTDYPIELSPLAKSHPDKPEITERFELVVNGKEIANAYTELNDPQDQRARFEAQLELAARGDKEAQVLDEDFIRALEYGLPPVTGLGVGLDRLLMLLLNQETIQEVLLFPFMRPEPKPDLAPRKAFEALGIPTEWVPIVVKAGFRHPHQLHGKQAGQVMKELNAWVRKLNLSLEPLTQEQVESWVVAAPEPPAAA